MEAIPLADSKKDRSDLEHKLCSLRREVRKGLDDLERCDVVSAADAFADLDKDLSK